MGAGQDDIGGIVWLGCFVSYVSYIMYKAATEKISSLRESTSPSFSLLRPQQVLRDQDQPRELIA